MGIDSDYGKGGTAGGSRPGAARAGGQGGLAISTSAATTRPREDVELEAGTKWLGLEVRDHRVIDAAHAEVEFVARYRVAGRGVRLHERSRFVKEDGRWYYLNGDMR